MVSIRMYGDLYYERRNKKTLEAKAHNWLKLKAIDEGIKSIIVRYLLGACCILFLMSPVDILVWYQSTPNQHHIFVCTLVVNQQYISSNFNGDFVAK
jgi:hypothetical protein